MRLAPSPRTPKRQGPDLSPLSSAIRKTPVITTPSVTKTVNADLGQEGIMRKLRSGLECKLVINGYRFKTLLQIRTIMNAIWIFWRTNPSVVGAELFFLRDVTVTEDLSTNEKQKFLSLYFVDMKVVLEVVEPNVNIESLKTILIQVKKSSDVEEEADAKRVQEEHPGVVNKLDSHFTDLRKYTYDTAALEESVRSQLATIKRQESCILMTKHFGLTCHRLIQAYLNHWKNVTRDRNLLEMESDRTRWRLHAYANMDIDLQAWYHAIFNGEVYRLRGSFWYRDALLPSYRKTYTLVDNALSPLEEAALSNVLCSPDTTYGDVAGQMFVMQAVVKPDLYDLFQKLSAQGAMVTKYPRQGRPSKKLFRFSYVEGHIYLTWKGKLGNQGVDMADVNNVSCGLSSELLKKRGNKDKAGQYLSLASVGRSIDLYFSTAEECGQWQRLLRAVVSKEQGQLLSVPSMRPDDGPDGDTYDWLLYCLGSGTRINDVEVSDWSHEKVHHSEDDENVATQLFQEEELRIATLAEIEEEKSQISTGIPFTNNEMDLGLSNYSSDEDSLVNEG